MFIYIITIIISTRRLIKIAIIEISLLAYGNITKYMKNGITAFRDNNIISMSI